MQEKALLKKRIIGIIPFLIISFIVSYTWFEILTTEYNATWRHYVALALVGINAMLYFWRYNLAILLTGIILILGTFNLLSFFTKIVTDYLGFGGVTTPEIQLKSLLILIIYGAINLDLLFNWYLDVKEERVKKNRK